MKKLALLIIFLLLIGLLLAGTHIGLFPFLKRYDYFPRPLTVSSSKKTYALGDSIEVTYEIHSAKNDIIRLYKNRPQSLRLFLREASNNEVVISDSNFYSPRVEPSNNDEIEVFEIGPNKPYKLLIKGQIKRQVESDKVIFDFGKFGSFSKRLSKQYMVGGYWKPINPAPLDSLEDFTNKILIELKNVEAQPGIQPDR